MAARREATDDPGMAARTTARGGRPMARGERPVTRRRAVRRCAARRCVADSFQGYARNLKKLTNVTYGGNKVRLGGEGKERIKKY
jgi:hypothetical protein